MARIELEDVAVHFAVYHASTRSLKNRVIGRMTLGGRIGEDASHRILRQGVGRHFTYL